jgi:hypothetical protein
MAMTTSLLAMTILGVQPHADPADDGIEAPALTSEQSRSSAATPGTNTPANAVHMAGAPRPGRIP